MSKKNCKIDCLFVSFLSPPPPCFSLEGFYAVGDPIFARDLWLVVELPSDARGRRTRMGRQIARHVCGAIRAGQRVGWTPLVVGGRSTCCRCVKWAGLLGRMQPAAGACSEQSVGLLHLLQVRAVSKSVGLLHLLQVRAVS